MLPVLRLACPHGTPLAPLDVIRTPCSVVHRAGDLVLMGGLNAITTPKGRPCSDTSMSSSELNTRALPETGLVATGRRSKVALPRVGALFRQYYNQTSLPVATSSWF